MSTTAPEVLLAKMTRARMQLQRFRAKIKHRPYCPVVLDPEGEAPCSCGAAQTDSEIKAALRELTLDH